MSVAHSFHVENRVSGALTDATSVSVYVVRISDLVEVYGTAGAPIALTRTSLGVYDYTSGAVFADDTDHRSHYTLTPVGGSAIAWTEDWDSGVAPSLATPAYLTAAEADSIIASLLISTDARRVALAALSGGDKALMLANATRDIDACRWRGECDDHEQRLMWPRVTRTPPLSGGTWTPWVSSLIDPDPDATGSESVASLPKAVRAACALQAAHLAARAAGLDPMRRVEEATRRGVTSVSGGGRSETFDLKTSNQPWARLCLEAQQLMEKYRATTAMCT